MSMHVLVVGGAGYIGSHVAKALIAAGHSVTVFDNLRAGSRDNILPGAGFVYGDIQDLNALRAAFSATSSGTETSGTGDTPHAVIHLAALKAAGESMTDPESYATNNIGGTITLLNEASRAGVRRIVFSSSAAVYGEPHYTPVDEEHPQNPENFYGFTKLEIERLLDWYDRLRGIRFASLRYFNAAGYDPDGVVRGLERNPANLIPVVMEVASGSRDELRIFGDDYDTADGTGVRDYIHVTDLANAHVAALDWIDKNDRSLTVNLGSETGISVQEILDCARRVTGREIPARVVERRPGDPAQLVASSTLAKKTLGWTARYSDLETLIGTSWSVYRDRLGDNRSHSE